MTVSRHKLHDTCRNGWTTAARMVGVNFVDLFALLVNLCQGVFEPRVTNVPEGD